MIKMYQQQSHAGSSPDYWDDNWKSAHFEQALRFCPVDPLRPLFEKYLRPDSLMLEGGCGLGQYLAYYASRGHRVIGLDFAQKTLKTLHARQPQLDLCGGDVSHLPFADESFDLYYSGGVVEHFEGGPEQSLKEARRVLKKNGILLLSVPYQSPLRTLLLPFKNWRKVARSEINDAKMPDEIKFFQYVYRRKEFEKMLASAGLKVIETRGYSFMWGLDEIPFVNLTGNGAAPQTSSQKENKAHPVDVKKLTADRKNSLLKRLLVSEDDTVTLAGSAVKFMRWFSANMMMYVCVRDSSDQ